MTRSNPYAWMADLSAIYFQAEQAKSKKPNLTLITEDQTTMEERNQAMSAPKTEKSDEICRMWNGRPLTEHGAFMDIEEAQRRLSMGSNALKGIGAMVLPRTNAANEAPLANRLELSEIFSFFGEVLAENSQSISEAIFRIEQAAMGRMS